MPLSLTVPNLKKKYMIFLIQPKQKTKVMSPSSLTEQTKRSTSHYVNLKTLV